jgi:hypothetical protein
VQDCAEQLDDLQREAESLRAAKVIYDEELLEAVKALTAQPPPAQPVPPPLASTASSAILDCLECPISNGIMRDPVTLDETGITYDRKSLCTSLLLYPDLDPLTGQRFDRPLRYFPNIAVRKLLMRQYGDSYYKKYDDTQFKVMYKAKWKELRPPSGASIEDQTSSGGGLTAGDILAGPMSGATIHSGSGGAAPSSESGTSNVPSYAIDGSTFDATKPCGDVTFIESRAPRDDLEAEQSAMREDNDFSRPHVSVDTKVGDPQDLPNDVDEESQAMKVRQRQWASCASRRKKVLVVGTVLVAVVIVIGVVIAVLVSRTPGAAIVTPQGTADKVPPNTGTTQPPSTGTPESTSAGATFLPSTPPSAKATAAPSIKPTAAPLFEPTAAPTALIAPTPVAFHQSLPPCTIKSLQNSSSPQYRAYEWVTKTDQFVPDNEGTRLFRMTQRFALATFFYSLNVPDRVNSALSECEWPDADWPLAVNCTSDSKILYMEACDCGAPAPAYGTIPCELGLLTTLVSIWFTGSPIFTSTIPTELGRLTGLADLDLQGGQLTSSIPTELGLLTGLTSLDLASQLTSSIPTELALLTGLTHLQLGGNQLTSTIPTELALLTGLGSLGLAHNQLTSTIPTELGLMTGLTYLHLSDNQLNSTIPTELGRLTGLSDLHLADNLLGSTIPTEFGLLFALQDLRLANNSLTGTFPSAMCEFNYASYGGPYVDCAEVSCSCCPNCGR